MTTEEVIAIAKTLHCDFEGTGYCGGTYFIHYEHGMYYGDTPEEALHSAGWKGKLPEDKCGGDGTYPTVI